MSVQLFLRRAARLALFALLPALTACGSFAATPQLIGSAPRPTESPAQLSGYAAAPENLLVVYNGSLDLEVRDVDAAAQRAAQLAYDYGGYLVESALWRSDGRRYATLTLAVPVGYYDQLYASLLRLGTVSSEYESGSLTALGPYQDEWNTYSHITLSLRPAAALTSLPRLPDTGWNPVRTFLQAFGFVAGILQWLVDILIWVVVVAGPFALLGWGVRAAVRRWRRPRIL
jgi:Domain of unknown function (DUF4349)